MRERGANALCETQPVHVASAFCFRLSCGDRVHHRTVYDLVGATTAFELSVGFEVLEKVCLTKEVATNCEQDSQEHC